MKKNFLIGVFLFLGVNVLFGASGFQKSGNYINIKEYAPYAATISSYTVFTSSSVPYGVERVFKINDIPSGNTFFQLGGSTTTITSLGMPLSEGVYYVEDTYFGNIYFLTDSGTADLRIITLKKDVK